MGDVDDNSRLMSGFPSAPPPPDAALGGHDAWSAPVPAVVSYNQSMQKLDKFKVGDDVEVFLSDMWTIVTDLDCRQH
jgi:hypothetical protein